MVFSANQSGHRTCLRSLWIRSSFNRSEGLRNLSASAGAQIGVMISSPSGMTRASTRGTPYTISISQSSVVKAA